jgi:ABC-type thiamin/hydroxymethylpyrimidine transport system permease subunit
MIRQLGPGPLGALALGGLAVGLLLVARLQGAPQALNLPFVLLTVLAAGALGLLLAINSGSLVHAPRSELVLTVAAAVAAQLALFAWDLLEPRFAAREWQWLSQLAEGLLVLPALLPAALIRRAGAATLGLTVAALAQVLLVPGMTDSPVTLLLVVDVALPVEVFLMLRRQDATPVTMAGAGALAAVVGLLVSKIASPLLMPGGLWPLIGAATSTALGGALVGAVVALVAARLRPRLGLEAPEVALAP